MCISSMCGVFLDFFQGKSLFPPTPVCAVIRMWVAGVTLVMKQSSGHEGLSELYIFCLP